MVKVKLAYVMLGHEVYGSLGNAVDKSEADRPRQLRQSAQKIAGRIKEVGIQGLESGEKLFVRFHPALFPIP